ncbi:MAG: lamin tail domain-containing protein [Patescibacteria group bacterium]
MWQYSLFTAILFFIVSFKTVLATSSIVINEFLIDPSQQVEIYNTATESADISGWYVDDSGGTTFGVIPSAIILGPHECYVFSENINLNKTSADTVRLFSKTAPPTDLSAQLIDSYSYLKSPGEGISWARIPDGNSIWATGSASFGLLNSTLISCLLAPTPSPTPTQTPSPTPTPTNTPTPTQSPPSPTTTPSPSAQNIILSEIYPNPKTGNNEWIELYNQNDTEVSLVDWYIDDAENEGSSPKKFNLVIPAKGFATFDLTSSIFNNDGDTVRLLNAQKQEVDTVEYASIKSEQSYSRQGATTDSKWCSTAASKAAVNSLCTATINPTSKPVASIHVTSSPKPTSLIVSSTSGQTNSIYSSQSSFSEINPRLNLYSETKAVLGASTSKKDNVLKTSFLFFFRAGLLLGIINSMTSAVVLCIIIGTIYYEKESTWQFT